MRRPALFTALVLLHLAPVLHSQCELQPLNASDPAFADDYARSVSMDGFVAVVGATGNATLPTGSAYAYVYLGGSWVEEQQLVASDGSAGDLFGHHVANDENVLIVGAPRDGDIAPDAGSVDPIALDEALSRLTAYDRRMSEVVTLRHFAGLTIAETADVLEISPRTVRREWDCAKAWLYHQLSKEDRSDL